MPILKSLPVELSAAQKAELERFVTTGLHRSREIIRAHVLLKLDAGIAPTVVADQVGCTYQLVNNVRKRFHERGLLGALHDAPRSGAPSKVTEYLEADLTTLACSDCPEGRDRWTVRLLSDELVRMGYEQGVSKSSVHRIQKKAKSSRGKKNAGASDK